MSYQLRTAFAFAGVLVADLITKLLAAKSSMQMTLRIEPSNTGAVIGEGVN